MIAGLGALASLAGYGLSAEGTRMGAHALRSEARRQGQEQLGFDLSRHEPLDAYAQAIRPGQESAAVGEQSRIGAQAIAPAAQAGGAALGVRPSTYNTPQMQAQAGMLGSQMRGQQGNLESARLGLALGEIERRRAMAQALYDAQMARAGHHGQGFRQAGELLQTLGGAGMSYGMGMPVSAKPSQGTIY